MAFQIIVGAEVTVEANDKEQAEPLAQETKRQLEAAEILKPQQQESEGAPKIPLISDSGYYSESAAEQVEQLGFDPYMATERQRHHAPEPSVPEVPLSAKEQMAAKVRSPEGRLIYAQRKVIVEPVFGQIKEARGFRRFLLRGLEKIRGEWSLVCLTHNLLKIWRYGDAAVGR